MTRKRVLIAAVSFFISGTVFFSCKKEDPEPTGPGQPTINDTLSGAWEAISGNMNAQGGFGKTFEANGNILTIRNAYPGNPVRAYAYANDVFTQIFQAQGNGELVSLSQNGYGNVYAVVNETSSTGGFNAVYDYEYRLYQIDVNGGTDLGRIPNPDNVPYYDSRLWMENGTVYFGGTSPVNISNNLWRLRVFKLAGDSISLVHETEYPYRAVLIEAQNGTYLLSYSLNNGIYSNILVKKFADGQLTSIHANSGNMDTRPLVFGNRLFGIEQYADDLDYTKSYVKVVDIQSGIKYTVSMEKTYIKLEDNYKDAAYLSVASLNHSTDNNYVILKPNGVCIILPETVSNLPETDQKFTNVDQIFEGMSHYYRVASRTGKSYLFRIPR